MAASREQFFEDSHGSPNHEYLSYSEIGLRTERISLVDWQNVDITGRVTKTVTLRNPIIAASMNSISEDKMAIAMARVGGAAIIHHANTPEEQRSMARTVYHYLAGIITNPWIAKDKETLESVRNGLKNADKDFDTLPVIDENERCVGLIDDTIFKLFSPDTLVKDAMRPYGSFATAGAKLKPGQVYRKMKEKKTDTVVLLDRSRRIGGLCLLDDIKRVVDSNPEEFSLHENGELKGRLMAFASIPTIPEEAIERIRILKKYIKVFPLDTSHGEHIHAVETLNAIKEEFSDIEVLAGNISTEQAAEQIAHYEPDGMQAGQGPGQICDSSNRLGFGTPQGSALYEVSKGAWLVDPEMPVIADGGITEPADTVRAFAIGGTAVKVGGLVSGTDETPVSTERNPDHSPFKWYWGMGSQRAQEAFAAARARYGNYGKEFKRIFIEGFEKKVPLKGSVIDVIEDHVMGVKLSMSAQGFASREECLENARFMKGNN
jgi:IMP dehydrogenase